MTGMGGGSLMTPILILLFGFDAKVAVGTDILHGAIFKSFGAARHRHARDGARAARALDAARLGAAVARRRRRSRTRSATTARSCSELVGVALIVGGLGFLVKTFVHGHSTTRRSSSQRGDKSPRSLIGAIGGFVVGLTSVGSGTFFGLAMLFLYPLTA